MRGRWRTAAGDALWLGLACGGLVLTLGLVGAHCVAGWG